MTGEIPRPRRTEFPEMGSEPEPSEKPAGDLPPGEEPPATGTQAYGGSMDESMMEAIRRGLKIPADEATLVEEEEAPRK